MSPSFRVSIMQPYFFPYPGYFSLIKNTDLFILLDEVQFIRHGWIERNRMLGQDQGWIYIKVPLIKKFGRATRIKDIEINNVVPWKQKIFAQIGHYKKTAPFYNDVIELIKDVFSKDYTNIAQLNKVALERVSEYLGLQTDIRVLSETGLQYDPPAGPGEWALNICKGLGNVTEYWNPIGGADIFKKTNFEAAGIELKFIEFKNVDYNQKRRGFEEGLSILDAMMFNPADTISEMLDNFKII